MPEVLVASWNIHSGVDGWGRPFDVVAGCRALDADVLVLQETWTSAVRGSLARQIGEVLDYRVEEIPLGRATMFGPPPESGRRWGPSPGTRAKYGPRVDHRLSRRERRMERQTGRAEQVAATGFSAHTGRSGHESLADAAGDGRERGVTVPGRGTVGLAVLSRLEVTHVQLWDLGERWGDPTHRSAIAMEVATGPRTGDPRRLVIVGIHLSHLRHGSPFQMAKLRRHLATGTETSSPVVVAGDMNLPGPAVSTALSGFTRVVRGRTWPAWRPVLEPDHLLVTPPATGVGEVLPILGSDHLPVRARVSWA